MAEQTIVGVFGSQDRAEKAVNQLRERGWDRNISILARDDQNEGRGEGQRGQTGQTGQRQRTNMQGQDLSEGMTAGGALGGLAGLAAGAGMLTIPGVGPVLAAGPIASTLTGVVTGGLAGGLVDYGIPREEGRQYEEDVRQGRILAMVKSDQDRAQDAERILRENGADKVARH